MDSALSQNWLGLMAVVFMLGAQHGMDPDHLATIDGLARFNAQSRPRLARWAGCLFSLGHGLMVTLVSGTVAVLATGWTAPTWLEHAGAAVSIVFLLALGIVNLAAVFRSPERVIAVTGFKARWLSRLAQTSHPVVIASIGAAFAVSFDTWSQAALFSMTAAQLAGWGFAVLLGLVFMAGMMATDGLNGLWVARMARQAGPGAALASRMLAATIGAISLAIAALGIAKLLLPGRAVSIWETPLVLGTGVILLVTGTWLLSTRLGRRHAAAR